MPDYLNAEPLIDLTHASLLFEREHGIVIDRRHLPALVMSYEIEGKPHGKGFKLTPRGFRHLRDIVRQTYRRRDDIGYRKSKDETPDN